MWLRENGEEKCLLGATWLGGDVMKEGLVTIY
jgi:hypothetical protein